jgi:hypothetical protein
LYGIQSILAISTHSGAEDCRIGMLISRARDHSLNKGSRLGFEKGFAYWVSLSSCPYGHGKCALSPNFFDHGSYGNAPKSYFPVFELSMYIDTVAQASPPSGFCPNRECLGPVL